MKPISVIEQLVGGLEDILSSDDMAATYTRSSKHNDRTVSVDFIEGTLSVYDVDHESVEKVYAIKATLEEIPND